MQRELSAEERFALLPEKAKGVGPFRESVEAPALILWRKHLQKVKIGFFVDRSDCTGDTDTLDQGFPFFVVGARHDFRLLELDQKLPEISVRVHRTHSFQITGAVKNRSQTCLSRPGDRSGSLAKRQDSANC